jgi:hypothetical protein
VESEHSWRLHCEGDLGVAIDVVNPEVFVSNPRMFSDIPKVRQSPSLPLSLSFSRHIMAKLANEALIDG